MPNFSCPTCQTSILFEFTDTEFSCPKCESEFVMADKDGKKVIRRKKGQEPVIQEPRKICPYCAESIRVDAVVCRYCGRELYKPKKKRYSKGFRNFMLILSLVLLSCLLLSFVYVILTPSAPVKDVATSYGAYSVCKSFVTDRLKAPATAEFAEMAESDIYLIGGETYRVTSYVDAQNSFGALIRMDYVCKVRYLGHDQWYLEDLKTSD